MELHAVYIHQTININWHIWKSISFLPYIKHFFWIPMPTWRLFRFTLAWCWFWWIFFTLPVKQQCTSAKPVKILEVWGFVLFFFYETDGWIKIKDGAKYRCLAIELFLLRTEWRSCGRGDGDASREGCSRKMRCLCLLWSAGWWWPAGKNKDECKNSFKTVLQNKMEEKYSDKDTAESSTETGNDIDLTPRTKTNSIISVKGFLKMQWVFLLLCFSHQSSCEMVYRHEIYIGKSTLCNSYITEVLTKLGAS